MEEKNINVLYVDDEQNNLISFTAGFRKHFNVFTALSAKAAETILARENIHVLITDQRMPEKTGAELLAETVIKYPHQIRILLTAYTDIEALENAINFGQIFRYLKKPWNNEELEQTIKEGYHIFALRENDKNLKEELQRKVDELNLLLKQQKDS